MRKLIVLLAILMISVISISETLEKIIYRDGTYNATFKEKKVVSYTKNYDKGQLILTLEFKNLTVKKGIPDAVKINDNYLDNITITEIAGITTMTFYMKKGIDYTLTNTTGIVKVNFKKSKIQKKKYTIIVDAGHGGNDSGATGNGLKEKDVALDVAQKLASNLKQDYNVIMTRSDDTFIPLGRRAEIGNDANADLFISIHLNAASSTSANGSEVFYFSKKESAYAAEVAKFENSVDKGYADVPLSDFIINDIFYRVNQQKSAALATDILDNIVNEFGLRKRGVFGANFAVLRGSNSPSILVEIGFVTNSGDMSTYGTDSSRVKLASEIAQGVRKHFE